MVLIIKSCFKNKKKLKEKFILNLKKNSFKFNL